MNGAIVPKKTWKAIKDTGLGRTNSNNQNSAINHDELNKKFVNIPVIHSSSHNSTLHLDNSSLNANDF